MLENLYTPHQVSFMLAVKEQAVWRWARKGKLRVCRFKGGRWGRIRVPESALREFLGLPEADSEKPLSEALGLPPHRVPESSFSSKAGKSYMNRAAKAQELLSTPPWERERQKGPCAINSNPKEVTEAAGVIRRALRGKL